VKVKSLRLFPQPTPRQCPAMAQTTIPYDFPPSVDQILERIPPLVNLLASQAFSPRRHYVGSDPYPAIVYLLFSIFPPTRGFILAPQLGTLHLVTSPPGSNDADQTQTGPEEPNVVAPSFPSAEQTGFFSRNSCSYHYAGEMKGFLDIVVSKIYPDGRGDYTSKILTIVVVERDDPTNPQSASRMARHLEFTGPQSHDERLRSYLVLGDGCITLELPAPTQGGRTDVDEFPVLVGPADSNSLVKELCGLAIQYWNQ